MEIPKGEITKTVYTLIKETKYDQAIEVLDQLLDQQPDSRAALSLLSFCHYQSYNFQDAAPLYDKLSKLFPEIPEYQFHLAQCLYNIGNFEEALTASYLRGGGNADHPLQEKVKKLQAAIQYWRDETADSKALLDKCGSDPDIEVGKGCLAFKQGDYESASTHFSNASKAVGMEPSVWYNQAIAAYQKGDLPTAANLVGEIIEYGAVHYPELKLCYNSVEDNLLVPSVGNTALLQKSTLVEACNLKAAIEFDLHKVKAARETLRDLPPRRVDEVDPITLHNQAILNIQIEPMESIRKLRYLLDQPEFPPETFMNLLITYWRYELYDGIADIMAAYEEFKLKLLSHDTRRLFEALIKREVAPEDTANEIEDICIELAKTLTDLVKKITNDTASMNDEETHKICNEFDDLVDKVYMPMLMTVGKIYWDQDNMEKVQELLRHGTEFIDDRDAWLLNCAHTVYRQGKDFQGAANLYEIVVQKYRQRLMEINAASLANLMACYIMLRRNRDAEELLHDVQQEELYLRSTSEAPVYHSCVMTLVIGTLYCVQNNYEFGLDRMYDALLDFKTKLSPDTWFYVKSCILSLISTIVKSNNIEVGEEAFRSALRLLENCEEHGLKVSTLIAQSTNIQDKQEGQDKTKELVPVKYGTETVAYEARYLKCLLQKVLFESVI